MTMSKNRFNGENLEYFSLLTINLRWAFSVYGRRGRDAGYPTPPAQILACGFPAPGSSVGLASAILVTPDIAIPFREVSLCTPALHVRHKFPMKAPSHRHPLPPVSGSPALRVL